MIEAQSSIRKTFFEFKWDPRVGPVFFINVGDRRLGFALFCHRQPERCFTFFGHTSPLCSRCTGLVAGFLGLIVLPLFQMPIPLFASALLMAPMVIDGVSELAGFRVSNNLLRFLTGLMFTFGFLSLMVK